MIPELIPLLCQCLLLPQAEAELAADTLCLLFLRPIKPEERDVIIPFFSQFHLLKQIIETLFDDRYKSSLLRKVTQVVN